MSAALRPVLKPPCEECGREDTHGELCEGEPRQTLHDVLARAQALADGKTREHARRYLVMTGCDSRRGALPAGKVCQPCRESPRYPDHRCSEHTVFLNEGSPAGRRRADSEDKHWLSVWSDFFERVDRILKT